jgi:hypothetical protein
MSIVEAQQQQDENGPSSSNACVLPQLRGNWNRFTPEMPSLLRLPIRTNIKNDSSNRQRFSSTGTDACPASNNDAQRIFGTSSIEPPASRQSAFKTDRTMLVNANDTVFCSNRIRVHVAQDSKARRDRPQSTTISLVIFHFCAKRQQLKRTASPLCHRVPTIAALFDRLPTKSNRNRFVNAFVVACMEEFGCASLDRHST